MLARYVGTTLATFLIIAGAPALASAKGATARGAKPKAHAAATGGTSAASGVESTVPANVQATSPRGTTTTAPTLHEPHAPIVSKHRTFGLRYKGKIYEVGPSGTVVPYTPPVPTNTVEGATGGDPVGEVADARPRLLVPGSFAKIVEGQAAAPENAPKAVKEIIWAGNEIVGRPYIYGGGHASFKSEGYDCSGTVSYALHGASLIQTPMDSSEMEGWGEAGVGRWVTVFANPGHAYMTVAGLRLDTSSVEDPSGLEGPRWRPLRAENAGFVVRHPGGF
ncbi:MAG: NlpC/P60 family protein [Solirubrobacteraceae bacterium]